MYFGRLGTLRCESRSLVNVAALQVNRGPRDERVESRDLIALGGVSVGAAERPFGVRELTQARIGDREKPREHRRRERVGPPFELVERFAEQLGALAQLAVEHHAYAHERFGDRVRAWIPQFFADRFSLLDRVLELRTRFRRLSAHPPEERDPEKSFAEQLAVGAVAGDRDSTLELLGRSAQAGEGPTGFRAADRGAHS